MKIAVWAGALALASHAFAADITEPVAFVRDVYRHIAAGAPPSTVYTPRLKSLFDEDARRANGEVGCIDFDFWINGQDVNLKNLRVTGRPVPGKPDRMLVVATFVNGGRQEIHFDFQKIGSRWFLDDVESVAGERWTLSKLLKCW